MELINWLYALISSYQYYNFK